MMIYEKVVFFLTPKFYLQSKAGRSRMRQLVRKVIKEYPKCDICCSKRHIQVHHLYSRSKYPRKALDWDNLIPLCKKCHTAFHSSKGGFKIPVTKKDYLLYKAKFKKPI